jgi:hypothetical protein
MTMVDSLRKHGEMAGMALLEERSKVAIGENRRDLHEKADISSFR